MSLTVVDVAEQALNDHEVLDDAQIEELLQQAEARLRAKANLGQDAPDEPSDDVMALGPPIVQSNKQIHFPKLEHGLDRAGYIKQQNGVAKTSTDLIVPAEQRLMAEELRPVGRMDTNKKVNDQMDAGSQWFNMPKTEVTAALKRDLQLIEMRSVLDPHRHYKKNNRRGKLPTFSQVGTVIEGPTEWFSGRINKKDRSKNFVEEEMRNEAQTGRFKRKYNDIQSSKTSGKKAHYKKLLAKRKSKG